MMMAMNEVWGVDTTGKKRIIHHHSRNVKYRLRNYLFLRRMRR